MVAGVWSGECINRTASIPGKIDTSRISSPEKPIANCSGNAGCAASPAAEEQLPGKKLQDELPDVDVKRVQAMRDGRRYVTRELNVLALFKGSNRFVFVYDDESREALIDEIRHKAADPAVPINWFDAAVLTERVRNHVPSPQEEF